LVWLILGLMSFLELLPVWSNYIVNILMPLDLVIQGEEQVRSLVQMRVTVLQAEGLSTADEERRLMEVADASRWLVAVGAFRE